MIIRKKVNDIKSKTLDYANRDKIKQTLGLIDKELRKLDVMKLFSYMKTIEKEWDGMQNAKTSFFNMMRDGLKQIDDGKKDVYGAIGWAASQSSSAGAITSWK